MRKWTSEERARQAQLIRHWQPWKTPGAKSPKTQTTVARNALKHGLRSAETKAMLAFLTACRRRLKEWVL